MKLIVLAMFLIANISYTQNNTFEEVLEAYKVKKMDEVLLELYKIDTSKISNYDKAIWLYYFADYNAKTDKQHIAFANILKAKEKFKDLNKQKDVTDCNILILGILGDQNKLEISKESIIAELKKEALENNDTAALISNYHQIAVQFLKNKNGKESLRFFKNIKKLYEIKNDSLKLAQYQMNIGTVHHLIFNNQDSALFYTKLAVPSLKKNKDFKNLAYNYNNQAEHYKKKKNYKKAIFYYKKADSISLKTNAAKSKVVFYENISDSYAKSEDYKNAFFYKNKLNNLKDSINDTQQNIEISKVKEQYDNEKLRADNLEITAEKKQDQNIQLGLAGLLIFIGVTSILIFKNTKKKQVVAEQEKKLHQQKVVTLLKEQELTSIDAMIEGQEKERQRIANDLHDDLGGLMANVKLHFNTLKDENSTELFDKTNTLLDEAYQKVRTIAHAKNSGVIAKQGLLKAVENMANKISESNKIKIEVIDFGLEHRLENSLELTIFRIIQELITNIIKHSEATQATINLTNHENSLNILIEDNGIGFNTKLISKTKGMGIHSIEKRVEHLEGTINIESEVNNGTTVIIDLPL